MKKQRLVTLQAEIQPLEMDLERFAVIVVDMQNAFASKGGMVDLWGFDMSRIPAVIKNIKKVIDAARTNDVKVIYIAHTVYPDLREVGPQSPFGYNKMVLESMHKNPKTRDKVLLRGTWGADIIDELKPRKDEILIEKRRYSAFAGTDLDMTLKTFDIKYLAFMGLTANICVETSLRYANHLEYFPILISDTTDASDKAAKEATINNVKQVFGWVTNSKNIIKAMGK
jgi:ureidoacrylate peracid hydrolase